MQNVKPAKPLVSSPGRNQQTFLFVIIGVAVALVVAFVLISSGSTRSSFDQAFFDAIPQERLDDGGFVLGDPDAAITIVEFQDWYCPHCQTYKPKADAFIRDYVATGQARYEFRALTTAGAGQQPNTAQVYNLLECVDIAKPGTFFYASDIAYEMVMSGVRGTDFSRTLAERTGVPLDSLLRCTQDEAGQSVADERLARSAGASSTPAVFYRIDGGEMQPVPDRENLGQLIEQFNQ